ncbi:MAG: energy transducer TonB [Blastocatellales bacterium]
MEATLYKIWLYLVIPACFCSFISIAEAGFQNSDTEELLTIEAVQPPYPSIAAAKKVEGEVLVKIEINNDGKVTKAVTISGPKDLREAALQAAYKWRFRGSSDSKSSRSEVISFYFCLSDKASICKEGSRFIYPRQVVICWEASSGSNH